MARRRLDIPRAVAISLAATVLCTLYLTGVWDDAKSPVLRLLPGETHSDAEDLYRTSTVNDELKTVCSHAQWNESLVFTCDESFGGIGNVRNSILMCVRFAIQAGAALVLPRIVIRDDDISNYKTTNTTEFGYMFDEKHFLHSMRASCPQMHIYPTLDAAVHETKFTGDPAQLHLQADSLTGEGLVRPDVWRDNFTQWLASQHKESHGTTNSPALIVNLARCYMTWPIYSDGVAFAHTFSSILTPRHDIRILATRVLRRLAARRTLPATTTTLSQPVLAHAFFGAHLRVEKDAMETWFADFGWTHATYEAQAASYLAQATDEERNSGSSSSAGGVIYVASGDANGTRRFAADAAVRNWTAVDKFDVLGPEGEEARALRALRWDQQAVVDYLVLLKASDFAGVAHSSFSWSVALKRHLAANVTEGYLNGPERLRDDLSVLYGTVGAEQFPEALWP